MKTPKKILNEPRQATAEMMEGLILANRHILDDQMELLKSMCPKHSRVVGHA